MESFRGNDEGGDSINNVPPIDINKTPSSAENVLNIQRDWREFEEQRYSDLTKNLACDPNIPNMDNDGHIS